MLAWYFAPADRKLRYGDGRTVRKGATHAVKRPEDLELCEYGLHASPRILDALDCAPGYVLCRVKLTGRIVQGDDKVCAEKRAYLAVLSEKATRAVLAEWSRVCALHVVHLWNAPTVVVRWLKTGDESVRVEARDAAAAAARADAAAAAYAAARAAARADAAAADVATERDWQNKALTRLALKAIREQK